MSNEATGAAKEKETIPFDFGLESETAGWFGAQPEQQQQTIQQPTQVGVKKTVDFGAGPVEIEAPSEEEFLKVALERQREYDREQQLLGGGNDDIDIPFPKSYEPIPVPSEDDLLALSLKAQTDPLGFLEEGMKMFLGMPIERFWEIDEKLQQMERMQYGDQVAAKFVNKHVKVNEYGEVVSGDYYATPENYRKILQYMDKEGMDFTYKNLEHAFREVKQYLKPIPDHLLASNDMAETATTTTAPTALSGSMTSNTAVGQNAGTTEQEIEEMFNRMTPQQLKAWRDQRVRY